MIEAKLVSFSISRTPIFRAMNKKLLQFSVSVSVYYSTIEWISKHLEDFTIRFRLFSCRSETQISFNPSNLHRNHWFHSYQKDDPFFYLLEKLIYFYYSRSFFTIVFQIWGHFFESSSYLS